MNVFDYQSYKEYVNEWIKNQANGGHGQLRQMALELGVNSVIMSQVFRGTRNLSAEQAVEVAKYLELSTLAQDYFLLLVQKERAGSHELQAVYERQIVEVRAAAQSLKNRIKNQKFSDESKATFYSRWHYSAIRLGLSIPKLSTTNAIADHLGIERSTVNQVIEFLMKNQLITGKENNYNLGPSVTHVGHDSPFVNRHHNNWRLQGMHAMDKSRKEDLFYSGPMALSNSAAQKIRKLVLDLVEKSTKTASESESETLRCLSIDWFEISK